MEDQKEMYAVNIGKYDGTDPIEIVVRKGEAAPSPNLWQQSLQ